VKSDLYIKILHFQQTPRTIETSSKKKPFFWRNSPFLGNKGPKKITNHVSFPLNVLFLNLALISNEMKNPSLSNLKVLQNQFIGFSIIFDFVVTNSLWAGLPVLQGVPAPAQTDYRTSKLTIKFFWINVLSIIISPHQPTHIIFYSS